MTLAHDMVDTYPRNLAPLSLGLFVACIHSCSDCAQACTACADACLPIRSSIV
jgi:hypothetical protein